MTFETVFCKRVGFTSLPRRVRHVCSNCKIRVASWAVESWWCPQLVHGRGERGGQRTGTGPVDGRIPLVNDETGAVELALGVEGFGEASLFQLWSFLGKSLGVIIWLSCRRSGGMFNLFFLSGHFKFHAWWPWLQLGHFAVGFLPSLMFWRHISVRWSSEQTPQQGLNLHFVRWPNLWHFVHRSGSG